jgi:hypothetical protein
VRSFPRVRAQLKNAAPAEPDPPPKELVTPPVPNPYGTAAVEVTNTPQNLLSGGARVYSITIRPNSGNSATVYLGGPHVSATMGWGIVKTDAPVTFFDVSLGDLYIYGTAGDSVSFIASAAPAKPSVG